jgi:hypothetical protein
MMEEEIFFLLAFIAGYLLASLNIWLEAHSDIRGEGGAESLPLPLFPPLSLARPVRLKLLVQVARRLKGSINW